MTQPTQPPLNRTARGVLRIVGGLMSVGVVLLLMIGVVLLLVFLFLLLGAHWLGG